MHFRTVITALGLAICSLSAQAFSGPTNYTSGTLFAGDLAWQKPDGVKRTQADAAAFCAASTNGGLTGWTVPNRTDLANLYFEKGSAFLSDNGWAMDVYQTSSQAMDGSGLVVSMTNGVTTGGNATGLTTCVHTPGPSGFLTNKNLTFLRPDGIERSVAVADAFCRNNVTGGLQGWRLPSTMELSELYLVYGKTKLLAEGWPAAGPLAYMWSATPYSIGREVVDMSNGFISYDSPSSPNTVTCVREQSALSQPTIISKGLRWYTPDSTIRTYANSLTLCNGTLNGVTGWRLPTMLELQGLYFENGWTELRSRFWPDNWIWASDPIGQGHGLLRSSDGLLGGAIGESYATTCVRPVSVENFATINNDNLTFTKPQLRPRPVENAINYCESTILGEKGGWRMPTNAEVQALYTARGSTLMTQAGFPSSAANIWTAELADAAAANFVNIEGNGAQYYLTCVINTTTAADGMLVANGMQWEKPSSTLRPWLNTKSACFDKNTGGQSGWRLPSMYELQALRNTVGATALSNAGWTMGIVWSYDVTPDNQVAFMVRMSDAWITASTMTNDKRYAQSCVRDANGYPAGTFTNAGLTFVFPQPQPAGQPWAPAMAYCPNAMIAGVTGWRAPTEAELTALYAAQTSKLVEAGWANNSYWTSTIFNGVYPVVHMGNGGRIYRDGSDANRYYVACVR